MAASAVITQIFRDNLARLYSNVLSQNRDFSFFKIGEGGHVGGVPKTPSASLTDIEAEGVSITGDLTFTNGSTVVTGVGTAFTTDLSVGDYIRPALVVPAGADPGSSGTLAGGEWSGWYQVSSISSDTSLALSSIFNETSTSGPARKLDAATGPLYVFRKPFNPPSDINLLSTNPAVFEVRSVVDGTEANTRPWGGSPTFYEVGFFDEHGVMVAYMTMDGQIKNSGETLYNIIEVTV